MSIGCAWSDSDARVRAGGESGFFLVRVWGTRKGRGIGRTAECRRFIITVLRTHRFGPDVQIAAKGNKRLAMKTGASGEIVRSYGTTHMLLNLKRSSARKGRMMLIIDRDGSNHDRVIHPLRLGVRFQRGYTFTIHTHSFGPYQSSIIQIITIDLAILAILISDNRMTTQWIS